MLYFAFDLAASQSFLLICFWSSLMLLAETEVIDGFETSHRCFRSDLFKKFVAFVEKVESQRLIANYIG